MNNQNLLRKPVCTMTESEFNSLPGFGAAQILNQLGSEVILDVAKYGRNRIVVFIYTDSKGQEFWQPYHVQFVENEVV